jgi:threonine/homoserine/homoserine lactone efflux protein
VFSTLHSYLLVTTLLVLTPGASTAVVVRNVIASGRSGGVAAALGALAGNTTYAAAAGLGLPALLERVPAAMLIVRVGGAAYLAWLGALSLWKAWRPGARSSVTPDRVAPTRHAGFREGLATNLLNPAVATFYFVIVPSFLSPPAPAGRFAVLAAIHVTMAFAYHLTWAWAFHALRRFWSHPAARRAVETLTGVALIALALRILDL